VTRKPRKNYYQLTGRPHVGMDDPEKFGLTYDEVVRLIDDGCWRNFYTVFLRKEKKNKLIPTNHICPLCRRSELDLDQWRNNGKSCLTCVSKKNKETATIYRAKRTNWHERGVNETQYCSTCRNYKVNTVNLGDSIICQGCLGKL